MSSVPNEEFNNFVWWCQVIEDHAATENNTENVRGEMVAAYY